MPPAWVVFADDLTGAAETGGVAWRHGLAAQIRRNHAGEPADSVTVIDTDTRGGEAADAAR